MQPLAALPRDGARTLLDLSRIWYRRGASLVDRGHTGRWCAINHLALAVITNDEEGTDANLEALATASLANFAKVAPDDRVYEGFIAADAELLRALRAGKLDDAKTFDALLARYREDRVTLGASARQWDSVTTQLTLLADLTAVDGSPPKIRAQAGRVREIQFAAVGDHPQHRAAAGQPLLRAVDAGHALLGQPADRELLALEQARQRVESLRAELESDPQASTRREQAARQRAASDAATAPA